MKYLITLALLLPSLSLAETRSLIISLGEQKKLTLRGSPSIWIQDRDILQATGQGSLLVLKGSREGKTLLKIGAESYQVQVLHPNKTDSFESLQQQLRTIVGIRAQIAEGDLLLTGRLYRLKDWLRIADYARSRGLLYQLRAQLTPELQQEAQNHFRQLLKNAALPPQSILFEPLPEVRVSTPELLFKKYQKLFGPYGIAVIRDEQSLEIAPTIKVEITVAEIKRNFSLKYGLRWPSSYSAKILPTGGTELDELPFNLTALENQGYGKILASPNILCRSGKEAEFLAGGEFPIKVLNYKTQDVVWKRYGILLRVKPRADAAGRMSLSIETEVTTLDDAHKVDDVPGLLTNRVSSHFDLTRPQTIALSGLIKREEGQGSEGLPLLARLPVLGALFSSKDFRENRSELVIFVRPTILNEEASSGESPSSLAEKEIL